MLLFRGILFPPATAIWARLQARMCHPTPMFTSLICGFEGYLDSIPECCHSNWDCYQRSLPSTWPPISQLIHPSPFLASHPPYVATHPPTQPINPLFSHPVALLGHSSSYRPLLSHRSPYWATHPPTQPTIPYLASMPLRIVMLFENVQQRDI
jgi:hypothetical protein